MNSEIRFLSTLIILVIVCTSVFAEEPTEVTEKLITNIEKDSIVDGSLLINSDSSRIVFLAKEGDKQYMIINDKRFKKFDYVRNPSFSGDGKVLSCIVTDKGYDRPVIEGKAGGSYVDIVGSIVLSHDGKHNAFVARHGNRPTFIVVLDGIEQEVSITDPEKCRLVFSPDGSRLAYNVSQFDEQEGSNKHFVVIDGKADPKYDAIAENTITFSPDGKQLAYMAKTAKKSGDKWTVVVDDRGIKYDQISDFLGLVFSPDSKRIAYAVNLEGKWVTVCDEKEGEKFDDVGRVEFSPDSSRMAYLAKISDKVCLVDNGVKSKKADNIVGITFSPRGNRLAYCVNVGSKWFVVLDGKKQKSYDNIAMPLLFNSDGTKLAYGAQEGEQWLFVTDGVESDKCEALLSNMFAFSPEGTNLVYGVINDDVPSLIVNGVQCKPRYKHIYNTNGGGLKFECDNVFHYIAAKGNDIYLVTERIK